MANLDIIRGRQLVATLTNKSGGSVAAGDVVVVDTTTDESFTTTTTALLERSIGIAQETIANNASGRVLLGGYAALVNVAASVTRGHYLSTSATAKQATGAATRAAGAFGQFLKTSATPSAWIWGVADQTAGGGGGLTHAYVGYNTVGATWETMTNRRVVMKQITLAAAGMLTAIAAYLRATANPADIGYAATLSPVVFDEVTAQPKHLLSGVVAGDSANFILTHAASAGDGRWFHMPVGIWLPAGTYWIGLQCHHGTANTDIAKDGSGTDKYTLPGGDWITDAGFNTITDTTDKYSIRASILT